MKISGRYSPGLYAGVTGFLLLIGINAFSIPNSLKLSQEKDAYRSEAELEKARLNAQTEIDTERAKLQRQVADTYAENEVKSVETFSIWGYVDNPKQRPKVDFRAFPDPNQKVYIYDAANKCIGMVAQGRFYWKHAKSSQYICEITR
jgi:hypothetical protein